MNSIKLSKHEFRMHSNSLKELFKREFNISDSKFNIELDNNGCIIKNDTETE